MKRKLLNAAQINDFEVGRDKVIREGNRCFVVDLKGERARTEIQCDFIVPEFKANIAKLAQEQKLKMIEAIRFTPYLSEEGRAERLSILQA